MKTIDEPPICPSKLVMIGRNSRGNWVAQEQNGLFGGLFVSCAQAVKYALFENGHHPEAIVTTTGIIELDLSGNTQCPDLSHTAAYEMTDLRRAA